MSAYYNEFDLYAAKWLENLIAAGHIADGVVDTRSIEDVQPDDLREFTQCHFFAGIGVWSYALRAAGWSDDRPVWTGSCPCQPFSAAGEGLAFADERHLWPHFHHLIKECRPAVVLGEQVASKAVDAWIDLVHADLEALDYSVGAVAFPAAGVGANINRERTYWAGISPDGLARTDRIGRNRGKAAARADEHDRPSPQRKEGEHGVVVPTAHWLPRSNTNQTDGIGRAADWLLCKDGIFRPVEPGTFPLAHGATARVGRLRGYGNAINAEAARVWIETVMECQP